MAVTATITLNGTGYAFAPPLDAAPAMIATQAWVRFSTDNGETAIPAGTSAHLGLLTVPIGPYCGRECDGHPVRDGIAYITLNQTRAR